MHVLVVEVDGYAFHANNPKQLERDKMKDAILQKYGILILRMKNAILQKYGIPILRLKTNESGEEERLYNILRT